MLGEGSKRSLRAMPDLAYEVDIQRGKMRLGDGDDMGPVVLRVTFS